MTTIDRDTTPRALGALCSLFALVALLVAPLAHGCHGPDDDHEPLVAPEKQNRERQ